MYELSDKFVKGNDLSEMEINHTANDSQESIEDCISLLSNLAIPLCAKLQSQWNLGYLEPGLSSYSKMHTLNRQLQELLSWTSLIGQTAIPNSFVDVLRYQINEGISVTTPRSMQVLEIFDNILLNHLNEGVAGGSGGGGNNLSSDFIANVESKMVSLLKRSINEDCNVKRCGSNVIGTSFYENIEFDYVILSLLPLSQRGLSSSSSCSGESFPEENTMKEVESILEVELLFESASKHLRACVKDCTAATNEFITNLMKPPSQPDPNAFNDPLAFIPSSPRPNPHFLQSLSNNIVSDSEEIRSIGEVFLSDCQTVKTERLNSYPILQLLLSKVEIYHDEIERDEKSRLSQLRRIVKNLEKVFRENTFQSIRSITNRSRFIQLKFCITDQRNRSNSNSNTRDRDRDRERDSNQIGFCINLDSSLPIQGTELLRNFVRNDSTGKIKLFFNAIKKFVKGHKISDSSNGYLSIFGWYIMSIHILIKFHYVFYIHGKSFLSSSLTGNNGMDGSYPEMTISEVERKNSCVSLLSRTSLIELLDKFFRYYVEEFNTFKHIISLRTSSNETLWNKSSWKKNPVLWRLSIEDPCDPIGSKTPYDLGSTISRPGQLTVRGFFSFLVRLFSSFLSLF
jgi:hypothetical protein